MPCGVPTGHYCLNAPRWVPMEPNVSSCSAFARITVKNPKADTPGCTTQACGIRDHRAEYERSGAWVLGISPDPVGAIRKFADKYALDFELLADEDHEVAELYGVWGEKKMYGKTYMGVQRATFVIDPDGTVARVFPKVSPKTHDEVVLEALGELASPA